MNWLKPPSRRVVIEKLPYFVLSFAFSMLASIGQGKNSWLMSMDGHPLPARIKQSFYGLVFYAWKTIAPTNLLPLYQMELPLPYTQLKYVGAAALVFVTVIALIVFHRRVPWLFVAAAAYAIMLAPVLDSLERPTDRRRSAILSAVHSWAILAGAGCAARRQFTNHRSASFRSLARSPHPLSGSLPAKPRLATTESSGPTPARRSPRSSPNGYTHPSSTRPVPRRSNSFEACSQSRPPTKSVDQSGRSGKTGDVRPEQTCGRNNRPDESGNRRGARRDYRLGNLLMNSGQRKPPTIEAVTQLNPNHAPRSPISELCCKTPTPQDAETAYLAAIAANAASISAEPRSAAPQINPQAIEQYRKVRASSDHASAARTSTTHRLAA
jgi:hypothetical protein